MSWRSWTGTLIPQKRQAQRIIGPQKRQVQRSSGPRKRQDRRSFALSPVDNRDAECPGYANVSHHEEPTKP
jgi:hypothetical protein